jgi:S1-C subfamily serine protease
MSEADFAEHAGELVVQVVVQTEHKPLPANLPASTQACFNQGKCIVGTGLFVDDAGDVVTAAHVAQDVQQLIALLNAAGLKAESEVGVSAPNYEDEHTQIAGVTVEFSASITATDTKHDVALMHVTQKMVMPTLVARQGAPDIAKTTPKAVRFAIKRPHDTDPVFACGYPIFSPVLVTTTGTIASAWGTAEPSAWENVSTAKTAGVTTPIDVYEADLRTNPGNSGGPVFRKEDGSVIGTSVATGPAGQNSVGLTIIIPAKYITEFLT